MAKCLKNLQVLLTCRSDCIPMPVGIELKHTWRLQLQPCRAELGWNPGCTYTFIYNEEWVCLYLCGLTHQSRPIIGLHVLYLYDFTEREYVSRKQLELFLLKV